ncbi:acid-sensing ion channel 4-like [Amphibalanus amphitrite]|uniref:acid-sensing ion channel 4-like n=1 Tax=Amphibalanus amphitrite TaxID=1232801 RepID=UPI001C917256|nr:acid-sensing ion channel 4-like [Amphibalanus amphitrite]
MAEKKENIIWTIRMAAPADGSARPHPARPAWSGYRERPGPPPPPASDVVTQLSITGVSLVCNPGAFWLRRAAWFLVIAGLLVWLCFQLKECITRVQAGGTTRQWSRQMLDNIPVPAITVCHGNVFKKNRVLRYTNEGVTWTEFRHRSFAALNWSSFDDIGEFYSDAVYNWSDMMFWCEVQGRLCSEVGSLTPVATLANGMCTTFKTNATVKKRSSTGQVILAFNETQQLDSYEHSGWWIHIHSHQIPFDEISIFTGLTMWLRVAVNKWYNIRLTHIRKSLLQSTGQCNAAEQAELRYNECIGFCLMTRLNMTVSCRVPWFENHAYPPEVPPCRSLAELARNSPAHHHLDEDSFLQMSSGCECVQPCASERYEVQQQTVWQLEDTVVYQDYPSMIGKNASRVDLSLPPLVQVITEREAYSFQTFISEVGGSLGLMLGGSLLTLVEIIDCVVTACCARRAKRW